MAFDYEIEYKAPTVHVSLAGVVDEAAARELWGAIAAACKKEGATEILGVSLLEPLATMDAFMHDAIFREVGLTR